MKKYKVTSISEVTGLTVSTITSFANNRNWSTKGGLDLYQILAVLNRNRRNRNAQSDQQEIDELREILVKIGALKKDEQQ